jgi:energy-converting hydrogenase Eha subunit C
MSVLLTSIYQPKDMWNLMSATGIFCVIVGFLAILETRLRKKPQPPFMKVMIISFIAWTLSVVWMLLMGSDLDVAMASSAFPIGAITELMVFVLGLLRMSRFNPESLDYWMYGEPRYGDDPQTPTEE